VEDKHYHGVFIYQAMCERRLIIDNNQILKKQKCNSAF